MDDYFGVDKNKIYHYEHCENGCFKLSIPPDELFDLLSHSTEQYSRRFVWLGIEKDRTKEFVSKIESDSFKIWLKGRVREVYNSWAPWLHGQVIATESGCEVTVFFKIDRYVRFHDKLYWFAFGFFFILFLIRLISDLMSSSPDFDKWWFFLLVLFGMWFFPILIRKQATRLAQKNKEMLCDFWMELITPYRAS